MFLKSLSPASSLSHLYICRHYHIQLQVISDTTVSPSEGSGSFTMVSMECRFCPNFKTVLMLFLLQAHLILSLMPVMCGIIIIEGFSSSGVLSGGVGGARGDETEQTSDGGAAILLKKV